MRAGLLVLALVLAGVRPCVAAPEGLPRYDINLTLDTHNHRADFRITATWTNLAQRPTNELVLNFYPHYRIPEGDHLHLAKTLELLRVTPSQGIDRAGRHGSLERVTLVARDGTACEQSTLAFRFAHDNPSAIVVTLPDSIDSTHSVTVDLLGSIRLPNKQGRWGHWQGVTFLTNALPIFAYYDAMGWHGMPFVPWHQPWWNEAGRFTATIRVPSEQTIACSAAIQSETELRGGWKQVVTHPFIGRDFAVLASKDYREHQLPLVRGDGRTIMLKCLALPQHDWYAKEMLQIVSEAIPTYSEWFGEFPYDQFTIAESYFGWNGNECSGLIMIDERVFGMPKLARGYVEYLVSHETCHQWWYNLVGNNGYRETVIDEGAATYFTHRLLDKKHGKNNAFMQWPSGLTWMPNIQRENYRNGSMYGAIRREQMPSAVGDLPGFNHLVGLFSGAYDRGSKVFGMIEARLGEAEFLAFTKGLVDKYSWRVLSVAALQAELQAETGQPWGEFFERWLHGKGVTDWAVESVSVDQLASLRTKAQGTYQTRVIVSQTADYDEPTILQVSASDGRQQRVSVIPHRAVADDGVRVTPLGNRQYQVELALPFEPNQVTIDPDRVLLDKNPANNVWKPTPRVYVSPFYSMLNEGDLTNDYDRWNFGAGGWIGGALFPDPWYMRSTMAGVRAGAYRTQIYSGGAYAAYRSDFRDIIVGADGLWDHWPLPKSQLGFNVEQRVAGPFGDVNGRDTATRAAVFARYVHQFSSSLYLPPLAYTELFSSYQDNFLPFARTPSSGVRPTYTTLTGLHTRVNLYTPYWDPERGFWFDGTLASGVTGLGADVGVHQVRLELAAVRRLSEKECLGRFSETRLAARVVTMGAFPDRGQFFALGGGTLFRGFDLAERQGSALWAANFELRIPLVQEARWDYLDHTIGGRNLWLAIFYDAGAIYTNGHVVNDVAHALGAGLRLDTALFGFMERVTMRVDVAKTTNANTPLQFWFGVQHAF